MGRMPFSKEESRRTEHQVYSAGNLIFSSANKWLHPLFELEDFLTLGAQGPMF